MGTGPEENTSLVRRFLTDVVAGGDSDALGAFVDDDVASHDLAVGSSVGVDGAGSMGRGILAAADVDVDNVETVAEDDLVAVRAVLTGTVRGLPVDLASTGESFEIPHVSFYRIEDGRITDVWSLHDSLGLVKQLDVLPSLSGSPEGER